MCIRVRRLTEAQRLPSIRRTPRAVPRLPHAGHDGRPQSYQVCRSRALPSLPLAAARVPGQDYGATPKSRFIQESSDYDSKHP